MTDPVKRPMMGCGHTANAKNGAGEPSCVICVGIHPGAETVVEGPDLSGRQMTCSYASRGGAGRHAPQPSNTQAAFFSQHPDREFDEYYCGCYGWD